MKRILGSVMILWPLFLGAKEYAFEISLTPKVHYLQGQNGMLEVHFSKPKELMTRKGVFEPALKGEGYELIPFDVVQSQKESKEITSYRYRFIPNRSGKMTLVTQGTLLKATMEDIRSSNDHRDAMNTAFSAQEQIPLTPFTLSITQNPEGYPVGQYSLILSLDAEDILAQEPLHGTLRLEGEGVVSPEVLKFPEIKGVERFDEPPLYELSFKNGLFHTEIIYHFALIAKTSYTIPEIYFPYITPDGKKHHAKTQTINVHVRDSRMRLASLLKNPVDQMDTEQSELSFFSRCGYGFLGSFGFGIVLGGFGVLGYRRWLQRAPVPSFKKEIKRAKSKKELLQILFRSPHEYPNVLAMLESPNISFKASQRAFLDALEEV